MKISRPLDLGGVVGGGDLTNSRISNKDPTDKYMHIASSKSD